MLWPLGPAERDQFVVNHRGSRQLRDPWRLQDMRIDDEPAADGVRSTATLFLTGRECPWKCAMCDLWQYTTSATTPPGAIPAQIEQACARLDALGQAPSQAKLYNAGSFFDPIAVPPEDYPAIASRLERFAYVIVESHPALIGPRLDEFRSLLKPALQVAMGLETAHPAALAALNKRMDVELFLRSARRLAEREVSLRVFVLIAPPFIAPSDQDEWLMKSIDVALEAGAEVISLIPTRAGNGTMELLRSTGDFTPPSRDMIEQSASLAATHLRGRAQLLLDPWDGTGVSTASA